jgi:hypothetical protein
MFMQTVVDPQSYLTLADLFQRIGRMWDVYLGQAWPFALGHVAVVLACIRPVREILSESGALSRWTENDEGKTECTRVLHEFVEETRMWGSQGTLVPMTDFTDRLDSKTAGLIDNLHSRVNLFLVLGIAGTFFAMFQFAADAGSQLPKGMATVADAERAGQNVAQMLAKHLSLAFPVGFFGLMLAIAGHFVAFGIDRRLRSALTGACQRAMLFRRNAARTQGASIVEALRPLENLHESMKSGLQPVFEGLRSQLEGTAGILKDQVAPLAAAVGRFESAAASLSEPARALTAAAEKLPETMSHVETLQIEERQHLLRLQETEEKLRATLEQAANHLHTATTELTGLPAVLSGDFSAGIGRMRDEAAELWTGLSRDFFGRLSPVAEALEQISRDVSALPSEFRAHIEREIARLTTETVRVWLENGSRFWNNLQPLEAAMLTAIGELRSASTELSGAPAAIVDKFRIDLEERLALIRKESAEAASQLGNAANSLSNAASEVTEVVRNTLREQSDQAVRQLQPILTRLEEAIVLRYPEALSNLTAAAKQSGNLATQTDAATSTMKIILRDIQASEQQLSDARIEVEKAIADFRKRPAATTPNLETEIQLVREAIGTLTSTIRERNVWTQLFPFLRNGRRDGREAPQ